MRQVCFHCQQAAEKALKALLEAEDLTFGRTHDLVALLDLLLGRFPDSSEILQACAILTDGVVGPRHPGIAGRATEQDADSALAQADAVVAWVRRQLERS